MMAIRISERDLEAISAYLDGQLSQREQSRLEARLQTDRDLRLAFEQMRRTRAVLRSLPAMRAPRNYVLTPQMVKARRTPPPSYPVLRLASVLATLLFVLVMAGDFLIPLAPVPAPLLAVQEEEPAAVMEAPAAATEPSLSAAAPAEEDGTQKALENLQTESSPPAGAMEMSAATPEPTPEALAAPAEPGLAADATASEAAEQSARAAEPAGWSILKALEVVLAILALVTGLAAAYLRRGAGS
jgi:hypothetical protein